MKLSNILLNQYNEFKNLENAIKDNGIKFQFSELDLPFEQLASLCIDYEKRLTSIDLPLLCYHNDKLLFEGIIKFQFQTVNFFKKLKNKINKFNSINITEFINDEYEDENELFVFNSPIKEFYEKALNWISNKEVEPKYDVHDIDSLYDYLLLNEPLAGCYYNTSYGYFPREIYDNIYYVNSNPHYKLLLDCDDYIIQICSCDDLYYYKEFDNEQDLKNELNRLRRCQPIDYYVDIINMGYKKDS